MRKAHVLVNLSREDAVHASVEVAGWLRKRKIEVLFEAEGAASLSQPAVPLDEFGNCDLVVTFGGDGTLIQAAQYCAPKGTPILGVYYGRFGFVTQCDPNEVHGALRQFLDDESDIEERMMLKGELIRDEDVVVTLHGLNEIAVQRSIATQMMLFNVAIDWENVTSYPADGILVATPTGSTAYSLSAGGPIVDPRVQAMLLTPITPHSLGARPLVLSPTSRVELQVGLRGDAVMSVDGRSRLNLLSGDRVVVTMSELTTRLVQVDRADFLMKLRTRLLWGARS